MLGVLGTAGVEAAKGQPATWQAPHCSYRIGLPYTRSVEKGATPAPAVFFLDLPALSKTIGGTPDVNAMKLFSRDGNAPLAFSLDYRYGDREHSPDEYVRPVTGYNGEKFPVADAKLHRLGYFSFRPEPGQTQYYLYFNISPDKRAPRARPDPSIRPWWIDAVMDPDFRLDMDADGKPDFYTWTVRNDRKPPWEIAPRPGDGGSCLRLGCAEEGTLSSRPGLLRFDSGVAARRVILYQQIYAEQGIKGRCISTSLPNAYREQGYAALYYFGEIPPKEWYELCIEGRVRPEFKGTDQPLWNVYNGPCYVSETHLQFPPEKATINRIALETDVAQPNDEIRLSWQSEAKPYLYPMRLAVEGKDGRKSSMDGQRVEEWSGGFLLEAAVTTPAGQPVVELHEQAQEGTSWARALRLAGAKPGRYRLRFEVKSRRNIPETVSHLETDLRVLKGPFEE
jgi:hypothetical protein